MMPPIEVEYGIAKPDQVVGCQGFSLLSYDQVL
jgi:hypothetical protein